MLTPFSDFVTFFAAVIRYYLPFVLFLTLIFALWQKREKQRSYFRIIVSVCCAAILGILLAKIAISIKYFSELSLILSFLLLFFGFFCLLASTVTKGRLALPGFFAGGVPFLLLLSVQSAISLWIFISDEALTATTVVNTTLIINGGALFLGFSAVVFLGVVFRGFFSRIAPAWNRLVFLLLYLLFAVQWVANLLINLIRLDYIKANRGIISYVAKAHDALTLWNYLVFAIAFAGVFLFFLQRHRGVIGDEQTTLPEPERRKRTILKLIDRRRMTAVALTLSLGIIAQGWYDAVVTRPPQLSPAVPVTVDAEGLVKIKVSDVNDGHLHRYSYITSDGYRVRFFVIQRYENSDKFGVVFDACQICGDDGYIESNNNVICIACNVSIFIPSIGKPGGCNPIPFSSKIEQGEIIIQQSDLEDGANYFSEKVEIMVADPVTGKELSNLKAPFHYSYKGHEFSFESEESMKAFVDDPEKFSRVDRRSVRIDGYKE
ncbi:MAG: hypothetical protein CSA21_06165 [Deltaproteobacteria bacterium]|nr:MAG: hypothetical protein CSA21_06165 [Deltaproteobacteria bacterium]